MITKIKFLQTKQFKKQLNRKSEALTGEVQEMQDKLFKLNSSKFAKLTPMNIDPRFMKTFNEIYAELDETTINDINEEIEETTVIKELSEETVVVNILKSTDIESINEFIKEYKVDGEDMEVFVDNLIKTLTKVFKTKERDN